MPKVIPLFKSGDKHRFSNYRPVSLQPQFYKILEKPFYIRLDHFNELNEILNENQYGFKKQEIANAMDKNTSLIGVFIDLKNIFYTVNHNLLLKKKNVWYTWCCI